MDFMRKSNQERGGSASTYPAQTLAWNTATVGAQYGSCAGIIASVTLSIASRKFSGNLNRYWRTVMVPSTLLGIAATSSTLYYEHLNGRLEESVVDERADIITADKVRIVSDKYSLYGLVSGSIGAVIVGQNFFSLSCTGLALGYTFYHVQNEFVKKRNSKTSEMYAPKWIAKE